VAGRLERAGAVRLLGTVVRLQVQRSRLKPGPRGARRYDPSPLLEVDALELGPRGAWGLTSQGRVLDVHHAEHPDSRNRRLANGLSLLPRAHYCQLRTRYGGHLVDGIAGENVLLDTDGPMTADDLAATLLLEVDGGTVEVTGAAAAPPCVEFSRFALGRDDLEVDDEVRAALDHLDHGERGFYLSVCSPGVLRPGAALLRP